MTRISGLMVVLLALLIVESPVAQTNYPEKPIRMVVGFPPGSTVDAIARLFGQKLAEALKRPVVIDNVTGAAGNTAADRVAKAAPDGYTLGLAARGETPCQAYSCRSCDALARRPRSDLRGVLAPVT